MLVRRRFAGLVVAGVVGLSVGACRERAGYGSLQDVPQSLDEDGVTIVVGNTAADVTVRLYEDPRCPYCAEFETTGGGPELRTLVQRGSVQVHYVLGSFLDDRLGGEGSKKAVNALRAVLEEGRFVEYHRALYALQPRESVDGFTDSFLVDRASAALGWESERFATAVRTMRYKAFVDASEQALESSAVSGTPAMEVNGKPLPARESDSILYGRHFLTSYIRKVASS
ncbi:DsbA family protein [Streptomyces sp. NPDC048338]|uniref:DsbA family protein n=1 Tax=Streptomyces sp. NPDC048338 TaxID=3365536 RepID=UPI00371B65BB